MARTILLQGERNHDEAVAAGAITPGHLIQTGSTGTVSVNTRVGVQTERIVAVEAVLNGGKTIDDAYAQGDVVFLNVCEVGDIVQLRAGATSAIAIGDPVYAANDGTVVSATIADTNAKVPVGFARTAKSAGSAALISVRIA